jgi:hypothetical protein
MPHDKRRRMFGYNVTQETERMKGTVRTPIACKPIDRSLAYRPLPFPYSLSLFMLMRLVLAYWLPCTKSSHN